MAGDTGWDSIINPDTLIIQYRKVQRLLYTNPNYSGDKLLTPVKGVKV